MIDAVHAAIAAGQGRRALLVLDWMDLQSYAFNMGAVIANLQSLEFTLRAVLHELPGAPPSGMPHGTNLFALPIGTELPESNSTSYDSLGQLIDKYNRVAPSYGFHEVDRTIVELRDALAHGRISGPVIDDTDLRLVKYSRPRDGRVTLGTYRERRGVRIRIEDVVPGRGAFDRAV